MANLRGTIGKVVPALLCLGLAFGASGMASAQGMACWFVPGSDVGKCKIITDALTRESGIPIAPRVATTYPEIFKALAAKGEALVYAGSFASALLHSRRLALPLAQRIDGKELYAGVLIFPKGGNPTAILQSQGEAVAYAIGASSGESCAKAATGGKASLGVKDHLAAANAVKAGKAKAAFVKNWWWEANSGKFPEFQMFEVPGISVRKNPDNILLVSTSVKEEAQAKLLKAAMGSKVAFEAQRMEHFDAKGLAFSHGLMTKGGLDPMTYSF